MSSKTVVEQLRDTLAWMDIVFSNIDDGVIVINPQWQVTFINDVLVEITGQDRISIFGKPFWQYLQIKKGGEPLTKLFNLDKMSLTDIQTINGVYEIESFKTTRLYRIAAGYVPKLDQAVIVLDDVTIELRAMEELQNTNARLLAEK